MERKIIRLMSAHDEPKRRGPGKKTPTGAAAHVEPDRRWLDRMRSAAVHRPSFIVEESDVDSLQTAAKRHGVRMATKARVDGRVAVWLLDGDGLRRRGE
jgi:hypothetical protein